MANIYSSDCESTTRTLLRHVLDTADSCTPRRRRSARISAQRALLETPSPKRWSSQTKTTARERSHGARSTGRLARGQAGGHLEEQTPRTLLKNILLTGDSLRTPVATQPTDTVLEDTQPFSQPLVGHSLNVHHSLPCPYPGPEGTEKAVRHRTQSSMPGLQNHMSEAGFATPSLPFLELQPGPPAPSEVTKAKRSQRALEPEDPEGSSGDEDISDRPASPESVSNVPEFLQAKQLDQFLEPAPSPDVAVLSSEPPEPVLARLPSRPRTGGPRPRQDPHKAGLSYYTKLFSFYAKMPMERKALEMVEKCLDKYLEHLCNDLEVFAAHAGRKTVKPEDLELLMRRQGLITDQVSLHVLVERHLPLEYRQLLIPCAFSGNSVFPAQ
ncbi:Centromere protein T [Heterocephalus glaber]|uniref:Centromere protein T n=1 Tax=Heterocephalus glaber TaxID=10181 RepID=G5C674_HETGA|nr:Centromere protein T [Heterocephalus glaber]